MHIGLRLLFTLVAVSAYSAGPPVQLAGICQTMMPNHGDPPQTGSSYFEIVVNNDCYKGNMKVKAAVQKVANTKGHVEGLFIQARQASDPDNATTIYGSFEVTDSVLSTLTCFSTQNSAVGHNKEKEADYREFTWTAPAGNLGDIVLYGTVVHEKEKFWVGLKSPVMSYNASCVASTESPVTAGAAGPVTTGILLALTILTALFM